MENDNVYKIVQYKQPPLWMELGAYLGAVSLFAAGVATGSVYYFMGITAMLLYWNYKLFSVIKDYVNHVNASEFSKLLTLMAEEELNKHKEGTFQDSSGLTKEQDDEAGPSTKGD